MSQRTVVIKRIISPSGEIFAEAKSIVETSDEGATKISQSVSVNVSSVNSSSSSSSSSSSYTG
ncbi:hypothetical protein Cal7507_5842 [Calothrix sp. PCC 7507]|nr:hypothetical protein Cal7507_5842 [Calothrix sp. PCC 7507]